MNKKTIAVTVAVVLVIVVAGLFFYAATHDKSDGPETLPVTEIVPVDDIASDASVKEYSEMDFDEPSDETRIILVEPENGELTDLLSEKVIRNDKIVDKTPTEE